MQTANRVGARQRRREAHWERIVSRIDGPLGMGSGCTFLYVERANSTILELWWSRAGSLYILPSLRRTMVGKACTTALKRLRRALCFATSTFATPMPSSWCNVRAASSREWSVAWHALHQEAQNITRKGFSFPAPVALSKLPAPDHASRGERKQKRLSRFIGQFPLPLFFSPFSHQRKSEGGRRTWREVNGSAARRLRLLLRTHSSYK